MAANIYFNKVQSNSNTIIYDVNGVIGDSAEGLTAKNFANELQQLKGKNLTLRINSPGGVVSDALQIYDLLSQHDGQVITEIYGATASAATIISQAGKRRMSENALMLVHHAWGQTVGNRFAYEQAIKGLDEFDKRIVQIYANRGAKMSSVRSLMAENNGDGRWIDAETALNAGLVDEVFKSGSAMAKVDSSLFKAMNLPEPPTIKAKTYRVIKA